MSFSKIYLLCFILIISGCSAKVANRHFWEIPDANLNYITLYMAHPEYGSAVVYNPEYCEQIGDACGFFLTHAFAHHFLLDQPLPPDVYPESLETRADCWAARYAEPESVQAVLELLSDSSKETSVPITGDRTARAKLILECATKYNNLPTLD